MPEPAWLATETKMAPGDNQVSNASALFGQAKFANRHMRGV